MALLDFNEQKGPVVFANEFDVCTNCLLKTMRTETISESSARVKLQNKLEAKKVVKINYAGRILCLCKECIKEFNDVLNPVEIKEAVAVEQQLVTEEDPITDKKGKKDEKGKSKK